MTFYDEIQQYSWEVIEQELMDRSTEDVEHGLSSSTLGIEGFISLMSPAADPMLEELAQRSQLITEQRFGRTIGHRLSARYSVALHRAGGEGR